MIPELLALGLVISACLAIFLDEAIYSVAALAATFMLSSLLYALNGATFVAVFQFAIAIGTLAILFLSGEMLSEKPLKKTSWQNMAKVVGSGVLLSLPTVFLSVFSPNTTSFGVPFAEALWNLRGLDVVIQGLVIMTVALGIVIVLYERRTDKD